ncbi:LOW QUALITY PROTEIN: hypothetical protein U9M48_035292, partial [Paspalum notatum var. saurae]
MAKFGLIGRRLEWFGGLEVVHDVLHGSDAGGDGDEEADEAHGLQHPPPRLAAADLEPGDVHADGEVDGERPESERADEPQHGVEEWQEHGNERGEHDDDGAEDELERRDGDGGGRPARQAHVVGGVDELGVGPAAGDAALEPREDGLREHLVRADEVHDDADVGGVDEPEGLVEGEAREDVARRGVAEGGVARAAQQEVEDGGGAEAVERGALHGAVLGGRRPERVLDLDEHVGEGVGEGDVAEGEEHVEGGGLAAGEGGAERGAGERAARGAGVRGPPLGGAEAEADEGVGEGGGDGDDGEPGDVVEAGQLREQELEEAEHHHVRAPRRVAVRAAHALPRAPEVDVLGGTAEQDVGAAEVAAHGVDVLAVDGAVDGVREAVAVGQQRRGVVTQEKPRRTRGPTTHPSCATVHASASTPDPTTAATMCDVAVHTVPAH